MTRVARLPSLSASREEAFCRNDEFFATTFQPLANDFFSTAKEIWGSAKRIHVGGINEVNASLGRCVHNRKRCVFVTLIAKGHGAEAEA